LFEDCSYFKYITDILVGGEPFPNTLLEKLKKIAHTNNTKIYNVYGPTETAVWSTVKNLTNTSIINIGKPISNTSIYVLDNATRRLLPKGMVGNLFIGGSGVCAGYHKRDDLNETLFTKNKYNFRELIYNTNDLAKITSSNEIVHLGRADFQVKIRGYRIELEEIERAINKLECIERSCCVFDEEKQKLYCFYIGDVDKKTIYEELKNTLPIYMIPNIFRSILKFPLNKNGKIDRKQLLQEELEKKLGSDTHDRKRV